MTEDPKIISELYIVLGKDDNEAEGIVCYVDPADNGLKPLCGGRDKVPMMMQVGKAAAQASGRTFRLVKFSKRGNLDEIAP